MVQEPTKPGYFKHGCRRWLEVSPVRQRHFLLTAMHRIASLLSDGLVITLVLSLLLATAPSSNRD
jgi:hypothetical protein